MVLILSKNMPVKTIADLLKEYDTRLWRIINYYVKKGVEALDLSKIRRVGIDETASKRGHNYVTLFVDMDTNKTIFVTEGKDSSTIEKFARFLVAHNGKIENILGFSSDLSPAFNSGIKKYFPKAKVTLDKFHVMKLLNKAVDEVRKYERKTEYLLNKTRYIWLKKPENLTKKERIKFEHCSKKKLKTGRAYRMKLVFQDIFKNDKQKIVNIENLKKWCSWAIHSRLESMKQFAKTLRRNWDGVIQWFTSGMANAILEGLNSLVQLAKVRARGFKSIENFKTMIYLTKSKIYISPT